MDKLKYVLIFADAAPLCNARQKTPTTTKQAHAQRPDWIGFDLFVLQMFF